ncbi:MAG: CRISPR-associated helicase Cas3' [Deltaproteobacteria bacterium]|jgi:CRISPR-associated endonuclease/helicase Cas3|nr:CRISPR-associated helicase Cas3' [Deltaproteobacteria bacterium]
MNDGALAKSDGTTLQEHIDDCLKMFAALKGAIPMLSNVTGLANVWDLLFVAIYIHDFGKCHIEFQNLLKKKRNCWNNQRHELYSIPFVDKLNINDSEKNLIKKIVLAHHKDFKALVKKYKSKEDLEFEFHSKWFSCEKFHPDNFIENFKHGKIRPDDISALIQSFSQKMEEHNIKSDINFNNQVDIASLDHPYISIARRTIENENTTLDEEPYIQRYWQNLLLWGALKICDHYGSAKITNIPTLNVNIHFKFLNDLMERLNSECKDLYPHQKKCFKAKSHCILIAPTGTGKTEAAMGWLENNISKTQGRTFYILPYTASINAMHQRLSIAMDPMNQALGISELVGIQHGKMMQYLSDIYENNDNISVHINEMRECYKKILPAVKVVTPFQILKFCFGVKNYEMGFVGLSGAKLIFDEIHAYDVITFAQIMVMLKYLIKYLKCEVFIMTATLPSFMLEKISKVLGVEKPIRADKEILDKLKRHKVILKQGTIDEQLNDIISIIKQKTQRIIVVCNTVITAQGIFKRIRDKNILDPSEMVLLHSRFNGFDRSEKERGAIEAGTFLLIGTQAIEVSLDIDYDIIFTEPAPIDALLQRFGRVNRKGNKPPCKVIICSEGGKSDKYIYKEQFVIRTLKVLKQIDIIDESLTQSVLDEVYPQWDEKEKQEFETITRIFEQSLSSLQPFLPHQEIEESFYKQFSNIQVLPARFLEKYRNYFEQFEFIKAAQLLVSISANIYARLCHQERIEMERFSVVKNNEKMSSSIIPIVKCKYTDEIGLIIDEQEEISYDSFI